MLLCFYGPLSVCYNILMNSTLARKIKNEEKTEPHNHSEQQFSYTTSLSTSVKNIIISSFL